MRLTRWPAFVALLLVIACHPAVAQDKRQFLILVTSPSQWLAERLRAGCEAAAADTDIACVVPAPAAGPPETIARIDNFIASGGMGIVLQIGGGADDPVYVDAIKRARDAGIPTVVASTTLIEVAAPYGEAAISSVGVSGARFVGKITEAIVAAGARDTAFCILDFAQAPSPLLLAESQLTAELEKNGAKRAEACPGGLVFKGTFEETLFAAVRDMLKAQDVRFVILPFRANSAYLDPLKQIAAEAGRDTVFVSAWASPFELGHGATQTLYAIEQGSTVDPQIDIAPTVQISTGAYCESCDCKKDTECRESCAKCN